MKGKGWEFVDMLDEMVNAYLAYHNREKNLESVTAAIEHFRKFSGMLDRIDVKLTGETVAKRGRSEYVQSEHSVRNTKDVLQQVEDLED